MGTLLNLSPIEVPGVYSSGQSSTSSSVSNRNIAFGPPAIRLKNFRAVDEEYTGRA
jgi:hypothetical protein